MFVNNTGLKNLNNDINSTSAISLIFTSAVTQSNPDRIRISGAGWQRAVALGI